MKPFTDALPRESELADDELVARVLGGERALFAVVLRRYNRQLFRAVRAILRDDADAEDALQQAYISAFKHLAQFDGRAKLGTWLTRIAVNEAIGRARTRKRFREVKAILADEEGSHVSTTTPEDSLTRRQLAALLEQAVDALPESYRMVIVLRDIEQLSTSEAAEVLEIGEENVRVRLHRARALLREALHARVEDSIGDTFPFAGARCDRIVQRVMEEVLADDSISSS
jgi:RNA polymerase sigma-70 factor (ECF subfamily)